MLHFNVPIKKLKESAVIPTYGTNFSAGADLYACIDAPITIQPGDTYLVPTGISIETPVGYGAFLFARSGLSTKKGLAPANKVGVVDSDYRGEVKVPLYNQSKVPATIDPQERIAQMIFLPYVAANFIEVETLSDTVRGEGGFGSTGR